LKSLHFASFGVAMHAPKPSHASLVQANVSCVDVQTPETGPACGIQAVPPATLVCTHVVPLNESVVQSLQSLQLLLLTVQTILLATVEGTVTDREVQFVQFATLVGVRSHVPALGTWAAQVALKKQVMLLFPVQCPTVSKQEILVL
jgi:hypothetical protein